MTPRPERCQSYCHPDDDEESAVSPAQLKRCAGCKKVWYCSKVCQQSDWRRHIFHCNPKRPIGTAYYLSRACEEGLLPVHTQTRKDFGFEKTEELLGAHAQHKLLGLFYGLFAYLDVSEKEVQRWQAEGRMVEEVKNAYARLAPRDRGEFYEWFLAHPYVLDGAPADPHAAQEVTRRAGGDAIRRAWMMSGGSPDDSLESIERSIHALPRQIQAVHYFYRLLMFEVHPAPAAYHQWITFGFVAAIRQADELPIGQAYSDLIFKRCTFAEFRTAYLSGTILALAEAYGVSFSNANTLPATTRGLRDVLAESPRRFKTVWYLKQYIDEVLCADSDPPPRPHKSISTDYGFGNCKNAEETKLLEELYTKYFVHADADPLELHKACIAGELMKYLGEFVKLKPKTEKYKRLLRNSYPMPSRGELQGKRIYGICFETRSER